MLPIPVVCDAIGKTAKVAIKAAKAADMAVTAGRLSKGAARTAGVVGDALKAGKNLAQEGIGTAVDKVLDAGRSVGFRVPATRCDIPLLNKLTNGCFVPGTLVVVCGKTALDVLTQGPAASVPPFAKSEPRTRERETTAASIGSLSPAELGGTAVIAMGVAVAAVARRRRRMEFARECDKLLGDTHDEDLGPEAPLDEQLMIEQVAAIVDESHDREAELRSDALRQVMDEAIDAPRSLLSPRRGRQQRNTSANSKPPGVATISKLEASLMRGQQRAAQERQAQPHGQRFAAGLSSPRALAIWCLLAAVTWWALPKSWGERREVAEHYGRTTRASSTDTSSLHLTPVAATLASNRDELQARALADPLSVRAYKPIEEIRPGDLVLAWDERTESMIARPVTRRFERHSDHLRTVTYLAADGDEHALETTDEHPFWVEGRGWLASKDLQPGDEFQQSNGETAILLGTDYDAEPASIAVYNFEVDGAHNYFVAPPNTIRGPPASALLVHNQCKILPHIDGQGHHIFAKRAFEKVPGYNPRLALAIPFSEIQRLNLNHVLKGGMTATQQRLFRELARSGRANTLTEHARIAREALVAGGLSKRQASSIVQDALAQLRSWGITQPAHIPWGN